MVTSMTVTMTSGNKNEVDIKRYAEEIPGVTIKDSAIPKCSRRT